MAASRIDLDGLPPIKVIGVGGGGCNALNRMVQMGIRGVEFVGLNTDAQALMRCQAETRLRTRLTAVLRQDHDEWKIVHLHFSVGVPDEQAVELAEGASS